MSYRQYGHYGRPTFRFGPEMTDWVKILIVVNVAVFLVQMIAGSGFTRMFGLVPAEAVHGLRLWQFATYMFLHGGFFHILFNMFMLWMFGSELERDWGPDTFIRFYFFTGIGAGVVSWITAPSSIIPIVGASGALFGILLAYAMAYPDRRVLVYFLFPVKVKHLVLFLGVMNFIAALQYAGSGIAHFAHLGGLLFGYIYLRWLGRSGWAGGGAATWRGAGPRSGHSRRWGPSAWREAARKWQAKRRLRVIDLQKKAAAKRRLEIDTILEKIAREGIESLSAQERELLEEESDRSGMDA